MQDHDPQFREDPYSGAAGSTENGHADIPLDSTEPYEPPRIPVGLPHVVQFVEGSLWHLPATIQNVGTKMSRYSDRHGQVSIAVPFLCEISGLGSKNTAEHAIHVMESLGVLKKHPGKGGNDRRSNSYTFLGAEREWRPLPAERRGTDPWIALSRSRRAYEDLRAEYENLRAENEDLNARLALLANGHAEVTDGQESTGADSYESAESDRTRGPIGHSAVTDGEGSTAPEIASHSYEIQDSNDSAEESGAIGHSKVTDGSGGREYLARHQRVEQLVLEHRDHYHRSFRGGIPSAVHYFSETPDREQELLLQTDTLRADREAEASRAGPPAGPAETPSGRRGVEYCPDCGNPYTTHHGAEYCPECTDRRNRGQDRTGGD